MTFKLEKNSVSVVSLSTIALVIGGGIYLGALAGDVKSNKEDVKKIEPIAASVAELKTGQAVMAERMKALGKSFEEMKQEQTIMKQDQKENFKAILDKLDKPR